MADKDPQSPASTSDDYDHMTPKWQRIQTLLDGTDAMRAAGTKYLPQHALETAENYSSRLACATLFNMTELTLENWVGKPFGDPVDLNQDVPESVVEITKDVDKQGTNVTSFCRSWFREACAKAFSHVLVDMPVLEGGREGRTRADDLRENRRPYWRHICPENLIYMGPPVDLHGWIGPSEIRFHDPIVVRNGFVDEVQDRIIVMRPGEYDVWVREPDKRKKEKWRLTQSQVPMDIPVIPLVTFFANRDGNMRGKPPIDDLSHLNVRHWQSTADQVSVMSVARMPILAASGSIDNTGKTLGIGPKALLAMRDPNGKFYYVEHSGRAIEAGRKDLLDLEEQMSSYGAEFLRRRPGHQTATARALNSAESVSPLQDLTIRFAPAVNRLLALTAMWMDEPNGGTVTMKTEFGSGEELIAEYQTLIEMRRMRDLSRDDLFKELRRRNLLRDDFTPDENMKNLLEETDEVQLARMRQMFEEVIANNKQTEMGRG